MRSPKFLPAAGLALAIAGLTHAAPFPIPKNTTAHVSKTTESSHSVPPSTLQPLHTAVLAQPGIPVWTSEIIGPDQVASKKMLLCIFQHHSFSECVKMLYGAADKPAINSARLVDRHPDASQCASVDDPACTKPYAEKVEATEKRFVCSDEPDSNLVPCPKNPVGGPSAVPAPKVCPPMSYYLGDDKFGKPVCVPVIPALADSSTSPAEIPSDESKIEARNTECTIHVPNCILCPYINKYEWLCNKIAGVSQIIGGSKHS